MWARYRLLAGKPPFFSRNPQEFLSCVAQARFEMPERLSADAKDLIDMILQPDPANRPSCSKILKHPWFDGPIKEPALARYVVRTPLHPLTHTHTRPPTAHRRAPLLPWAGEPMGELTTWRWCRACVGVQLQLDSRFEDYTVPWNRIREIVAGLNIHLFPAAPTKRRRRRGGARERCAGGQSSRGRSRRRGP